MYRGDLHCSILMLHAWETIPDPVPLNSQDFSVATCLYDPDSSKRDVCFQGLGFRHDGL